jgi:hypothetical protein
MLVCVAGGFHEHQVVDEHAAAHEGRHLLIGAAPVAERAVDLSEQPARLASDLGFGCGGGEPVGMDQNGFRHREHELPVGGPEALGIEPPGGRGPERVDDHLSRMCVCPDEEQSLRAVGLDDVRLGDAHLLGDLRGGGAEVAPRREGAHRGGEQFVVAGRDAPLRHGSPVPRSPVIER